MNVHFSAFLSITPNSVHLSVTQATAKRTGIWRLLGRCQYIPSWARLARRSSNPLSAPPRLYPIEDDPLLRPVSRQASVAKARARIQPIRRGLHWLHQRSVECRPLPRWRQSSLRMYCNKRERPWDIDRSGHSPHDHRVVRTDSQQGPQSTSPKRCGS